MKKKNTIIKCITMMLILVFVSSACSAEAENTLLGEYEGTSGSYLQLKEDGTCYFQDGSYGSKLKSGTWYIEDGVLYIKNVLNYTLYAELDGEEGELLVKGKSSRWGNELFRKID